MDASSHRGVIRVYNFHRICMPTVIIIDASVYPGPHQSENFPPSEEIFKLVETLGLSPLVRIPSTSSLRAPKPTTSSDYRYSGVNLTVHVLYFLQKQVYKHKRRFNCKFYTAAIFESENFRVKIKFRILSCLDLI